MCGICGLIAANNDIQINEPLLRQMTAVMRHRGPDDEGIYLGARTGDGIYRAGLGQRRLSIIDLSPLGHQPMSNEDGTVWITYNGEIYNFQEIKHRLEQQGHTFRSHTDTEVIIHLYEEEGENCVNFLRGMFAFAIWDESKRKLFLARDRAGVKPLYFYHGHGALVFGSEIKSLLKSGIIDPGPNIEKLDAYLTLGYVPGRETMFRGIHKIVPGTFAVYDPQSDTLNEKAFWDSSDTDIVRGRSQKNVIEEFRSLFTDCVRMRLVSDVPLGVFLSGGLDSSAVVAMMSRAVKEPVKTFTVGYREKESSEFEYARIVAKHFKTDHHEFNLEPADFYDFIPKLAWHFDEPVAEPAAIPLYFISKLAREYVTVLLSGEGADELFGGYSIYRYMRTIAHMRRIPAPLRPFIIDPLLRMVIRAPEKRKKYGNWLSLPLEQRYFGVPSQITRDTKEGLLTGALREKLSADKDSAESVIAGYYAKMTGRSALSRMLYVDYKTWLPDDLLLKADKMSMATSVELRVPFLDYRLTEFAAGLPDNMKVRNGQGKYIVKKAMEGILPDGIIYRTKKGFPVPINAWFKGDFSERCREILLDKKALGRGYFTEKGIESILKIHRDRREDMSKTLFGLVMLETWHQVFIDKVH